MRRIIVDEKKWVGESQFLHALSYWVLLPGPVVHQLAIYIGWLMHRWPSARVAGGLFVLPGIISIMTLSYVYAAFGKRAGGRGAFLRFPRGWRQQHFLRTDQHPKTASIFR